MALNKLPIADTDINTKLDLVKTTLEASNLAQIEKLDLVKATLDTTNTEQIAALDLVKTTLETSTLAQLAALDLVKTTLEDSTAAQVAQLAAILAALAPADSFTYITGAGTTIVKASPGRLRRIIINAAGTRVTIYNSATASGDIIGIIELGANYSNTLEYDLPFSIGLTVVTVGAATNLTMVYR